VRFCSQLPLDRRGHFNRKHFLLAAIEAKPRIALGQFRSVRRASFNRGYGNTVVAGATATRAIPNPTTGAEMPAQQLQDASLSALGDMFAVVVPLRRGRSGLEHLIHQADIFSVETTVR
jgi:hypothetical protein